MVFDLLFNKNQILPFGLIILGILLFLSGWTHRIPTVDEWDKDAFQNVNLSLNQFSKYFIYLWHLGTTPVAMVIIATTFIINFQIGITVLLVYMGILFVESVIKRKINRQRPFMAISNAVLSQPTRPRDSSFPSGDAMRVCFLAVVYPTVFNLHLVSLGILCMLAFSICVGRIALGAHYPLDVLGGAGLGLLGAGCVTLLLDMSLLINPISPI